MPLDLAFPLSKLHPAEYNPRAIEPDALAVLAGSLRRIGFAKPIIATPEGLIVAGHQRTRAAASIGLKTVPVWTIRKAVLQDEIRLNQLHNGTDTEAIDVEIRVPAGLPLLQFTDVPPAGITGPGKAHGAAIRATMGDLLVKHGPWGGVVATDRGEIISAPHYAMACRLLRMPTRVWTIPHAERDYAMQIFRRQFGKFSYEHIERKGYLQTFAQPPRRFSLTAGSSLYDNFVIPELKPGMRVLDFGAGAGKFPEKLRAKGVDITDLEFFRRLEGEHKIDTKAVHRMVEKTLAEFRARGPFDVVVCEGVLNSVDSVQSERDVLACLSGFCKTGGRVFLSGRRKETAERLASSERAYHATGRMRYLEFLDNDGLTGLYFHGGWVFQKFHSKAEAIALAGEYFGDHTPRYASEGGCWQMSLTKHKGPPADFLDGVRREFNLPWPGGMSVARGEKAVETFRHVLKIHASG